MKLWNGVLGMLLAVGGCGGDDGGGISAVAQLVHGAAVPMTQPAGPLVPAPASDGTWFVTPDRAQVTIEMINFEGTGGSQGASAPLSDCVVTFDKTTPSLMSLLDCPFSIPPGTYRSMTVHVGGTFQILIDDAANSIYTDPASSTKLSGTPPAGGGQLVDYTRALGGTGIQQPFLEPLVVADGDTISLAIVLDAIQTLHMSVSGGGANLVFQENQIPVNIFPTLQTPGVARYLTSAATAQSYNDSSVLANVVRVYYASDGQPMYLFDEQTAGMVNQCSTPAAAYPVDPANVTPLNDGSKIGGWLGRDSTLTTCWVVPGQRDFSAYRAYMTLGSAANVGDSATLSCQATTAPTPPSSGMTYASGCPPITPAGTAALTLVAQ